MLGLERKLKSMKGVTATIQLPDDLTDAIEAAVQASFDAARAEVSTKEDFPMYLNKRQLCQYLNVSFNTLQNWLKASPDFPRSTIDGIVRFNRDDVTEYMRNKNK